MKKVFQTKLKNITKVLALVIVAGLATFTGCKSYDSDISQLNTDIVTLRTDLTAQMTALNSATTTAVNAQIATLTTQLTAQQTQLTSLQTQLTALQASAATKSQIDALQSQIDANKALILSQATSIAALQAYQATATAQILLLQTQVAAAAKQADLVTLQTTVNSFILSTTTTLNALGARVTTAEGTIITMNGTLTTAVSDLATLKGRVDAQLATITGLQATVTTNTADIAKLKTDLTALQASVAALQTSGTNNTTDIAALQTKFDGITSNFKALVKQMNLILDIFSSRLTSLVFVPGGETGISGSYVNGIEAVNLASLKTPCGPVFPAVIVAYNLNPSFVSPADIDIDNLQFVVINTSNLITLTKGLQGAKEVTTPTIKATFLKILNGKIYVTITLADLTEYDNDYLKTTVTGSLPSLTETFKSIALQVPLSSKAITENNLVFDDALGTVTVGPKTYPTAGVITAQYVRVNDQPINNSIGIARPLTTPLNPFYPILLGSDGDYINQTSSQNNSAKGLMTQFTVDQDGIVAVLDPRVIRIPYNTDPAYAFDLSAFATMAWLSNNALFNTPGYGTWTFKFDKPTDANGVVIPYLRGGNGTDQEQFITFDANGKLLRKVYTQPEAGAAIGRTPVVRIQAFNSNYPACPAFTAYTKLFLEEKPRPAAFPVDTTFASTAATCIDWTGSTNVQWMNEKLYNKVGISKESFHAIYSLQYKLVSPDNGVVIQKVDPMITDSYILQWTLTAQQIWTSLTSGTNPGVFSIQMVYVPSIPEEYPYINITLNHTFTLPGLSNLTTTINKYWYKTDLTSVGANPADADFKAVKHNVGVPFVGENVTTNCVFFNNINQAFEQNVAPATYPFSLLGLDPTKYEYYFKNPQPALADGTILIPSADGQSLLQSIGGDLIAKFYTYNSSLGNILELQKTVTAKLLLNKDSAFLKARVGIRQKFCPDIAESLSPITEHGNPNFDVVFLRPIKVKKVSPTKLVDAKNFGEVGTYIPIREMVQLADWRDGGLDENGNMYSSLFNFTDHNYYWGFYGVTRIWVEDPAQIKTDLNGTWLPIGQFPNLEVAPATSVLTPSGTITATDGYITYKNNGNAIGQLFHLRIPVTIEYVWGSIVNVTITVDVAKTASPSGVRRK